MRPGKKTPGGAGTQVKRHRGGAGTHTGHAVGRSTAAPAIETGCRVPVVSIMDIVLPHPRWNTGREASEINRARENSAARDSIGFGRGATFSDYHHSEGT